MSARKQRATLLFIGTDGSMGFRRGQAYDAEVVLPRFGYPVLVRTEGLQIPYGSLAAFMRNWRMVP